MSSPVQTGQTTLGLRRVRQARTEALQASGRHKGASGCQRLAWAQVVWLIWPKMIYIYNSSQVGGQHLGLLGLALS